MIDSTKTIAWNKWFEDFIKDTEKYRLLYQNSDSILSSLGCKILFQYKGFSTWYKGNNFVWYNIAKIICDEIARWVIGVWYTFDFWSDEINTKVSEYIEINYIHSKLLSMVKDCSISWVGILREVTKWDNLAFRCVPMWYYRPWYDVSMWEMINEIDHHIIYAVEQDKTRKHRLIEYKLIDDTWYLYDSTSDSVVSEWVYKCAYRNQCKSNIVQWWDGTEYQSLDHLPLHIFNSDNECGKDGIGASDIESVYTLILEVYKAMSMISLEFINNFESKISVSKEMAEYLHKIKKQQWSYDDTINLPSNINLFTHTNSDDVARFIQKDPWYIQYMYDWVEDLITKISSLTGIPTSSFGINKSSNNETATLTNSRNNVYIDKINTRRIIFKPILKNILLSIAKSYGYQWQAPSITYNDIIENELDPSVIIQSVNAGIISKETASKKLYGFTEDQRQKEKVNLTEQNAIQSALWWWFI